MRKGILALIVGIAFLYQSCGETKHNQDNNVDVNATVESDGMGEEMQSNPPTLDIVFPSPLQVASIFKRSGLTYIENITNDPKKIESYDSRMSKSFNFGVYGADLSYCVLNNQTQKALDYLNNVKQLSHDLGIATVFQADDLFTTFEKNMGNEDSMIYVIASIQERLDNYLQKK